MNQHAVMLDALAQRQAVAPRPLLMNDAQCLAIMAAARGGSPAEAVEWSMQALARIVVGLKNGQFDKAVRKEMEEQRHGSAACANAGPDLATS